MTHTFQVQSYLLTYIVIFTSEYQQLEQCLDKLVCFLQNLILCETSQMQQEHQKKD